MEPVIMGDDSYVDPSQEGLLKIGVLSFKTQRDGRFPRIIFFLDLTGRAHRDDIIGIGPRSAGSPALTAIVDNLRAHQLMWRLLAGSFTAWLDLVAATHGHLGYGETGAL